MSGEILENVGYESNYFSNIKLLQIKNITMQKCAAVECWME